MVTNLLIFLIVSDNDDFKIYYPLISSAIVIALFGIERYLSYRIRLKERKINWYYKGFIDPNLEKINIFFETTKTQYSGSAKKLKEHLGKKNYNDYKVLEISKFAFEKRVFEEDVLLPIVVNYKETGQKLTNIVLDIEDVYVNNLDKLTFDETFSYNFNRDLSMTKGKFYEILFTQIQKK